MDNVFIKLTKSGMNDIVEGANVLSGRMRKNGGSPWLYPAYAAMDQPVDEIFAGSGVVKRLKKIQKEVDRKGLFRKWNVGGYEFR